MRNTPGRLTAASLLAAGVLALGALAPGAMANPGPDSPETPSDGPATAPAPTPTPAPDPQPAPPPGGSSGAGSAGAQAPAAPADPEPATETDDGPEEFSGSTVASIEIDVDPVDGETLWSAETEWTEPVAWSYLVTNTGEEVLTDIEVTDSTGQRATCPSTELQPGGSMTCSSLGVLFSPR